MGSSSTEPQQETIISRALESAGSVRPLACVTASHCSSVLPAPPRARSKRLLQPQTYTCPLNYLLQTPTGTGPARGLLFCHGFLLSSAKNGTMVREGPCHQVGYPISRNRRLPNLAALRSRASPSAGTTLGRAWPRCHNDRVRGIYLRKANAPVCLQAFKPNIIHWGFIEGTIGRMAIVNKKGLPCSWSE